jgi:hypothetical protein
VLQKAGEAVAAEDYLSARATIEGVKERVEVTLAAIDKTMPRAPARKTS